jgi:MFS family permease
MQESATLPAPRTLEAARPSAEGLLSPQRAALTVGLVLVVTMAAFEALAVATVLPEAERDLGGLGLYGLIFVAYMLASLAGSLIAGREADRHGLAAPLAVGLAIFAVGLTIGGAAPTMPVLIAARGVQGIGAGAIVTVAYAAIARGYDESLRPRMFAVLSSAWVVPGLVGPSLAGAVAEYATWRLVFLGILPLVVVGGVFTIPSLRKLGPPPAHESSGGVLTLLRETPRLLPSVFVFSLLTLTFFGAEAYLPLTLSDIRGQSATVAGLALSAGTISWTTGAWIQARTAQTWDRRLVVAAGLALVGAGVALLIPLAQGGPIWLAPASWAVAGLGIGMAYSSMSLIILGSAPCGREGAASAAINTSSVLGSAAGTGIGAAFVALGASGAWSTATSVTLVFAMMIGFVAVGIVATRRLPR